MSIGRGVALVLLGIALGVGLTVGSYYGVKEYAPDLAVWYLERLGGPGKSVTETLGLEIDPSQVRTIVGDILASDQGRAIVTDLIEGQSRETFESLVRQAMESPEFRRMLGEVLRDFLASPEGKELLRQIGKDVLSP
ncbi:MAG: hypothetical protein ACOX5Q_06235 [Bacillota bacterium]|nr:hypothetical protein [Candidatus Fermentithermobacillaceae bacterium]